MAVITYDGKKIKFRDQYSPEKGDQLETPSAGPYGDVRADLAKGPSQDHSMPIDEKPATAGSDPGTNRYYNAKRKYDAKEPIVEFNL